MHSRVPDLAIAEKLFMSLSLSNSPLVHFIFELANFVLYAGDGISLPKRILLSMFARHTAIADDNLILALIVMGNDRIAIAVSEKFDISSPGLIN
jgi:hypothetical protein